MLNKALANRCGADQPATTTSLTCDRNMPSLLPTSSRLAALAMGVVFVLSTIIWSVQCVAENDQTGADSYSLDWSSIDRQGNQIALESSEELIAIRTLGTDPYFHFSIPPLSQSRRDWVLQWRYFCPQGISGMELRVGRGIARPNAIDLPPLPAAEGWTSYAINLSELSPQTEWHGQATRLRIDLGRRDGVRLRIQDVTVRPITDEEIEQRKRARQLRQRKSELAQSIRRYQSRTWPGTIHWIKRNSATLQLSGSIDTSKLAGDVRVVARLPYSVSADALLTAETSSVWEVNIDASSGELTALVPCDQTNASSLLKQRLQLVQIIDGAYQPISAAKYVEVDSIADHGPPPPLRAAKGLTGITPRLTVDHLRQLGIQHASVNLVITGLISHVHRPGWTKQTIMAREWWVNQSRLEHLDRNVRIVCDAGAVAAAIILIPTSARQRSPLAHPESSNAGTYAMPDLTSQESIQRYAATIQLLAERYAGAHPEFGRIDHWIVHNEVDYGWQWTNMGKQPMEVYLEHYVRSMRLIDAATRRHNPHARVFISLTHRWNTRDSRPWQTYAPKQMLSTLIRWSKLEGDFPWGIAYHPYPQSLWRGDFWNDQDVDDDFDTPLITLKNLQVLDRFMKQPSSRFIDGSIRPLICSEQGFHCDENDPQQLEIQAAALLRTWSKLRQCPTVLAFDYHRPSDHPDEGGLRLGLRGLPSKDNPLGNPKPGWEVYSAIGTDREKELIDQYRHVWDDQR